MSDSSMFQRTFPDGVVYGKKLEDLPAFDAETIVGEESLTLDYIHGPSFPQFFGLAMPLLKWGLPIKPVQLDNVLRFENYLAGNDLLVLSYEYIKPASAKVNEELIAWVRNGGTLIYVGDGSDPYHGARLWWREAGYRNPAQHLFETAGLDDCPHEGVFPVGEGNLIIWNQLPARITLDKNLSDCYREKVRSALEKMGISWEYRNDLTLCRGPYIISSVMNESVNDTHKIFEGRFVDMLEEGYPVVCRKEIAPDECAILFDLDTIEEEDFRVIGTCARVSQPEETAEGLHFSLRTADGIRSFTRLRLPREPKQVTGADWSWDDASRSVLIWYDSDGAEIEIEIVYD